MTASEYVFTSESVTAGHPDKLCDQISDALVGQYLRQDETSRVVAECAASTGILFVSVKTTSDAVVDVPNAAREVIRDVGYTRGTFNAGTCTIMTSLNERADGRSASHEGKADDLQRLVAQDQVTVFGYACRDTPQLMPLPIALAHRLARRLDAVRCDALDYLAPDGKCQVGVIFRDDVPHRVHSITLVASQTHEDPPLAQVRGDLVTHVVDPVFADASIGVDAETRIAINPEGPVIEGGPALHAGLTGRKNGVDTYGEFARHSGAALSGKDPTRIDRVGAYAARHAAKMLVAAGRADRCEVQLSYSIGLAAPVSVRVHTFGTGRNADTVLSAQLAERYDFRIGAIIERFRLRALERLHGPGFYRRLAVYGHVGRVDLDVPWEVVDDDWAE